MTKVILDGSRMLTRAQAHDELARAFNFPAHYGRNLDALYDLLSELPEPPEVEILHLDEMLAALGPYGTKIQSLVGAADSE